MAVAVLAAHQQVVMAVLAVVVAVLDKPMVVLLHLDKVTQVVSLIAETLALVVAAQVQ
jgi:hypothetical protein